MAFHDGDVTSVGLDALMAIEDDALNVDNEVRLFELTMNALRTTMSEYPESVLHLEHQPCVFNRKRRSRHAPRARQTEDQRNPDAALFKRGFGKGSV